MAHLRAVRVSGRYAKPMLLSVTPLYTACLAILALVLSVRIIRTRTRQKILWGTGDDDALMRSIRAHANLVEHAPLVVLMMAFYELNDGNALLLHATGASLLIGRCVHAWSLITNASKVRVVGMALTFGSWALVIPFNLWAIATIAP